MTRQFQNSIQSHVTAPKANARQVRPWLAIAFVALVIGMGPRLSLAAEPFRVGAIFPFSGAIGIYGQSARRGIELAIEERGGKVGDRSIQVTWEDSETKPQVAVQKASRLLASGLDTLVGAGLSSETLALIPLAADAKVPHLVTLSADDRITGSSKTRYTFRTNTPIGATNLMVSADLKTNGTKAIYAIAGDVGVLRDGWKQVRADVTKAGLKVEGEDFPPIGNKDWAVLVEKIARSGADTVVFFGSSNDSIGFLKQAHEVGLSKRVRITGPFLLDDTIAKAVGAAAEGVQSGLMYNAALDNAANKRFVAAYTKKFGEAPDMVAGEAYDGMAWWLDVVHRVGGTDKEKWIDAFVVSTRPNSVKGLKKMRACDNQAEQIGVMGIGVKGTAGQQEVVMSVRQVVPAETLFTPCK